MNRFICLTSLIILVFLAGLSLAGIPKMINYQGMLTDNSGTPLTDTLNLTFKIYDDPTAGNKKWEETQNSVPIINGLFNVILGSVTPIDTLSFNQQYWLDITVGAEHMPTRLKFTSVGYAYRAQKADTADYARGGGGGSGSPWIFRISDGSDTTITTGGGWGVARFGNQLFGNADSTHVNLGVACTTGTNGQNYKYSTIGGGWMNTATGERSTVGGGAFNKANGWSTTVGGGNSNTASVMSSTVGGGEGNAAGYASTVGGGLLNTAGGNNSTIGGGYQNTASGLSATVGGGYTNTVSGDSATVGGGTHNTASGRSATVGGGEWNTASGKDATIGGGYQNNAIGDSATVGGGTLNTASGRSATVGGGEFNTASGRSATVSGGYNNTATGMFATICGGSENSTVADYSMIIGGYADTLTSHAEFSMAFGRFVDVNYGSCVVFFDSTYNGHLLLNRDHRDANFGNPPIRVGTSTTNGNGAFLTTGGVWTDGSSRSKKENFEELEGAGILDKIENMTVTRWNFKGTEERHIGPVAEDFYRAFGCGTGIPEDDSTYVSAKDIAGVSLVAIQELSRMVKEQQREIEALKEQIKTLQVR